MFGYFSNSSLIDWYTAQLRCLDWGGNLATVKSEEEDSLLLYSITDLDETFTCHIGLNDIDYEAEINGSLFVWIDGSNSTYRNFGTLGHTFPRAYRIDQDCVRHRYIFDGTLSQGWLDVPCYGKRNCYFCSKQGITINYCHNDYLRSFTNQACRCKI